jgi:hypothetical protein
MVYSVARRSSAGSASTRPWPPIRRTFHKQDVPSAGTPSGIAWRRQPNTTSGSIWPMMLRACTAAGNGAFRMQPSGAVTRMVASEAALFGMRGPTMHFTPNVVYASV